MSTEVILPSVKDPQRLIKDVLKNLRTAGYEEKAKEIEKRLGIKNG